MKVKFANGVIKNCNTPTEQKVFKNTGGETAGTGWILIFKLFGGITSTELDELITSKNVLTLQFTPEATAEEIGASEATDVKAQEGFTLAGYNKVTSSVIRHAEDVSATYAEIQLTKGV